MSRYQEETEIVHFIKIDISGLSGYRLIGITPEINASAIKDLNYE